MPNEEMIAEIEAAVEKVEVDKEEGITEEVTAEKVETEETQEETADVTEENKEAKEIDETGALSGDEDREEAERPEDTSPALSNELLERAVSLGIPLADAKVLGQESLGRIFNAREEESRWAAEESRKVTQKDEVEEPVDPFADMPKFDPDVHDEATIAAFEKLTAIVKQQHGTIENFDAKFQEAQRVHQEANQRDTTQWFDKQVSNLGEDFADALGTGGYDTLDRGSAQFTKREALANQVSVLLAGYEATGQEAPPRDEVFDIAAKLVFHGVYQQIHEKGLSKNLGKRASQHIQRAGGQKAKGTQTPDEEIAAVLDSKFPAMPE